MIYKIKGKVDAVFPDAVGIECHGIGYYIFASSRTLCQLVPEQDISLYIEHIFKQDSSQVLVGFTVSAEKDLFKLLIGVQGIGVRSALSILSIFSIDDFHNVVASQDIKSLQKAEGIGKKTAERVLLEMKNKIKNIPTVALSSHENEAFEALEALGFSRREISNHIRKIKAEHGQEIASELLVKLVLQQLQ